MVKLHCFFTGFAMKAVGRIEKMKDKELFEDNWNIHDVVEKRKLIA